MLTAAVAGRAAVRAALPAHVRALSVARTTSAGAPRRPAGQVRGRGGGRVGGLGTPHTRPATGHRHPRLQLCRVGESCSWVRTPVEAATGEGFVLHAAGRPGAHAGAGWGEGRCPAVPPVNTFRPRSKQPQHTHSPPAPCSARPPPPRRARRPLRPPRPNPWAPPPLLNPPSRARPPSTRPWPSAWRPRLSRPTWSPSAATRPSRTPTRRAR